VLVKLVKVQLLY